MNYYIQGSPERAEEIKAAFDKLGYDISWPGGCANPDVINIGVERNGAKYVVAETAAYIRDIIKTHPDYKELELPVEPNFKVGDKISWINHDCDTQTITDIRDGSYITVDKHGIRCALKFAKQDEWELVPPKPHYDIANFYAGMPVLVRETNLNAWQYVLFSHCYIGGDGLTRFNAGLVGFTQCIPFNDDTKHLLGTTDMPSEEFINW